VVVPLPAARRPIFAEVFVDVSAQLHGYGRRVFQDELAAISPWGVTEECSCPVPGYRVHNMDMRSGELARNAGVNLQTIRFYERRGLLPKPPRTVSGYRTYQQRDLERVLFIRRNQELGFTLAEIKQLMDLHSVLASMGARHFGTRPNELQGIIEIGRERLLAIREKSRTLNTMRRQLEWMLQQLESASTATCPVQSSRKRRPAHLKKIS